MKIGIAISTFTGSSDTCVELAQSGDRAGIDGVFVYDHLLGHTTSGEPRETIEAIALLGALAVETRTAALGTLVIGSGIRLARVAAEAMRTVNHLSGGRVVVGVGTGDAQSVTEDRAFGIDRGDASDRRHALQATVAAIRGVGVPVWVGGRSTEACEVAARYADGLNVWGTTVDRFVEIAEQVEQLRSENTARSESFAMSWAGLVDISGERPMTLAIGHNDVRLGGSASDIAAAVRPYRDAVAAWAFLAPLPTFSEAGVELVLQVKQELQRG